MEKSEEDCEASHADPLQRIGDVVDIPFRLPDRLFGKNGGIRMKCIDCHAGGEPARVVLSGVPSLPSNCTTALSKRSYMMKHYDHLRKILLTEPRGYPCQNVNFIFPAPMNNKKDDDNTGITAAENHTLIIVTRLQSTFCICKRERKYLNKLQAELPDGCKDDLAGLRLWH